MTNISKQCNFPSNRKLILFFTSEIAYPPDQKTSFDVHSPPAGTKQNRKAVVKSLFLSCGAVAPRTNRVARRSKFAPPTASFAGQEASVSNAAWKLRHQLIDLTNCLWDAFEKELLEFSIGESEKNDFNQPLPFNK